MQNVFTVDMLYNNNYISYIYYNNSVIVNFFSIFLQNLNITFRPSVEVDDPEGFYVFFESLLLEMMKMGTLIPRVDPELHENQENYAVCNPL